MIVFSGGGGTTEEKRPLFELRSLLAGVFIAACLWGWIFGWAGGNFWLKMACSTAFLAAYSLWFNRRDWRKDYRFARWVPALGLGSALLLYVIFWLGGWLLTAVIPASGAAIAAVYTPASILPGWSIVLLLVLLIAPAEEIFWRGLVQKRLVAATNPHFGLIVGALFYALVHLWAANMVLVLAALVCGLFWGLMYLKTGSLFPGIISHALWDILIFVIIPLN